MLKVVENKQDYLTLCLGVLLNKRKKDPRYIYKNGYNENKALIGDNSLNSKIFSEFLKDNNINNNYLKKRCQKCNRELEKDFEYCPYCGEKIK